MNDPKQLLQKFQPKEIKQLKTDRQMCIVRFSPDGKQLVAGGQDARIRRWDEQLNELAALEGHGGWVQALAFSPLAPERERGGDEGFLYSADSWGKLICWQDAKPVWTVEQAHDGWIRGLAVSADGQRLATCGMDRTVRIWSATDGKKLHELTGHAADVLAVAFHPDGQSVVSGDMFGVVKQWEVASGKVVRELDAKSLHRLDRLQDTGGARCLVFDAEGKTLACAGTQPKNGGNVQGVPTILLFDWATGKLLHTLKSGADADGYVYDLHFHPAGFLMAVSSGNPGVGKFYFQQPGDAPPFFITPKMANCHSLAVHPDGRRLVVSATNGGSNGNGRGPNKDNYPGNWSPLVVWEMPKAD